VKETLQSVIIFCLALVIVFALCTFSCVVYLIGSRLSLLPAITPEMVAGLIPAAATQMFLPAVLVRVQEHPVMDRELGVRTVELGIEHMGLYHPGFQVVEALRRGAF
jgi:hypothetical protein